MNYQVEERDGAIIIRYKSEVAPEDNLSLKELMKSRTTVKRFVYDLTAIALITTPGLGALVALNKYALELDKRIVLVGLSPYVKEIFNLTRLSRVFDVRPTVADALKD